MDRTRTRVLLLLPVARCAGRAGHRTTAPIGVDETADDADLRAALDAVAAKPAAHFSERITRIALGRLATVDGLHARIADAVSPDAHHPSPSH